MNPDFDVEVAHPPSSSSTDSRDGRDSFVQALNPHVPRILVMVGTLLVLTEGILAAVVVFSRMSALQQFACVGLIVVLPAAVLGFGLSVLSRASSPLRERPFSSPLESTRGFLKLESAPWTPGPRQLAPLDATVGNDLAVISEQLEEMSLKARWLPLGFSRGIDEQDFTYLVVKLRAAVDRLNAGSSSFQTAGPRKEDPPAPALEVIDQMQEEFPPKRKAANNGIPALPDPLPAEMGPSLRAVGSVPEARDALREGDAASAISGLKRLLGEDGEDAEAAELLGIAYEKAGDMESALEAMRIAVLIDPKRASAHYNYGVLLAKADRLLDSYRQNEVALRLNPDYTSAREFQKVLQLQLTASQNGAQAVINTTDELART